MRTENNYGIGAKDQAKINDVLLGASTPKSITHKTTPSNVSLFLNGLDVTDWGVSACSDYGSCTISNYPDRRDYHIRTDEAMRLAQAYVEAKRRASRGSTRMWSYDDAKKTATGLSKKQARHEYDEGCALSGIAMQNARNYYDKIKNELAAIWDGANQQALPAKKVWSLSLDDTTWDASLVPDPCPQGIDLTPLIIHVMGEVLAAHRPA